MAEYIEREAFIAEQRHLYCENCERRKGRMKNGKMRFAYEIGDAPCRACRYGDVLDDLEDYPAADVRPVKRGKWIEQKDHTLMCSECLSEAPYQDDGYYGYVTVAPRFDYCPNCGADMREES